MHDILQLPYGQDEDADRPAQLVELEADEVLAERRDGDDKDGGVQSKRRQGVKLAGLPVEGGLVGVLVVLDYVKDEVAVGVVDGDDEPSPLGGAEEGDLCCCLGFGVCVLELGLLEHFECINKYIWSLLVLTTVLAYLLLDCR